MLFTLRTNPTIREARSQRTFWCSVLSDYKNTLAAGWTAKSQCTFWCSVLSDLVELDPWELIFDRLNAPSGAQCFPTFYHTDRPTGVGESQCTFWCSVLSDPEEASRVGRTFRVSMHLLVLSAFRPPTKKSSSTPKLRLNAPSGAQCFPTLCLVHQVGAHARLNAPSGAQCFPTGLVTTVYDMGIVLSQCTFWCSVLSDGGGRPISSVEEVSMHLLVLSAFRREAYSDRCSVFCLSQCTFWCSVLSDPSQHRQHTHF